MEVPRYFWPISSPLRGSYVHMHQIWPALCPVMIMSSSTGLFFAIVTWNQAYLNPLLFVKLLVADYTMSFVLNLAFLHMIQDLWPGNFSQLPPWYDSGGTYFSFRPGLQCGVLWTRPQRDLSHPPYAGTTIIISLVLQLKSVKDWKKIPFFSWPQAGLSHWTP